MDDPVWRSFSNKVVDIAIKMLIERISKRMHARN